VPDELVFTLAKHVATEFLKQPDRVIGPDEPLLTSGLIDSFHLVDLALFIEDSFGVHIDDSELNASTFDSLNQLVALIQSRK
jgi:acyl carrier protein